MSKSALTDWSLVLQAMIDVEEQYSIELDCGVQLLLESLARIDIPRDRDEANDLSIGTTPGSLRGQERAGSQLTCGCLAFLYDAYRAGFRDVTVNRFDRICLLGPQELPVVKSDQIPRRQAREGRVTILQLANSLSPEEPLRQIFLSSPLISRILNVAA